MDEFFSSRVLMWTAKVTKHGGFACNTRTGKMYVWRNEPSEEFLKEAPQEVKDYVLSHYQKAS